ncbi:MAG TPA: adenylate/guanylate cyclase domain-containing protein [Actinomycetota bacterium]|nr:adenylate/guanylate cyclase domain-containing protein [Actinomycetota bacterium]
MAQTTDPVEAGRTALERHAWQEAYDMLVEADRNASLPGDGLRLLADAAWWSGQPDAALEAFERAYGAYLKEGTRSAAAMVAFELARQHAMRLAMPMAQGWMARAERLGAEDPEWPVNGWLAWMRGLIALTKQGDLEAAATHYDRALEFAERTGDRDLQGITLYDKGYTLCARGEVAAGLALMDEAMTAVVGEELQPVAAGYVYCGMIAMCSQLGDYARAAEWTEATTRWCARNGITGGFPGVCRVHRAEIMRLRGSWPLAEQEARLAAEELPRFNFLVGLGYAFYEIGEIRRRMGDFTAAEDAYARAHEHGLSAQPGLSLLRLAQGKVKAASEGIRQALAETKDRLARVRLLAAQAEIDIAAGDLETASAAVDELDGIVETYEPPALHAMAACVRGALGIAQGDPAAALPHLQRARQQWQEVDAPFEAAETRLYLGSAYRALGNDEAAALELRAARSAFERLGARPAAQRAGELLGQIASSAERPERVRRAFMFTDIVKSTDLVGVIGDGAWESLIAWHDQALRSLIAAHGGGIAHHTGDGFFAAFDDAASALRCAVAIQRALAEHRRAHGFAPFVRIGIHVGEASQVGQDFRGGEVHKAARVAAQGGADEIVASEETVAEADGFTLTDVREVSLKGIAEPVRVGLVDWR